MPRTLKIALPLVIVIIMMFALIPASVGAEPAADAANGQKVWEAKLCKNCHGDKGEGKYAGPLAGTQRTAAEAIAQVRKPRANMPAFNDKQITDQEITDIVDYMKTLQRPAAFTPVQTTVPADAPAGTNLMVSKRCVACHGTDFAVTARFIAQAGRKTITVDEVTKQLRTPRANMPMFNETQVTAADIALIANIAKTAVEKAAGATPAALPTTGGDPGLLTSLVSLFGVLSVAAGLVLRRFRR